MIKRTNKQSGRSMVEMIGVLAIIGVLSVGALSGYRMAMTRYRANEIIDYAMRVAEGALSHGQTQKTGHMPFIDVGACPNYVNGEAEPFGLICNPWDQDMDEVPTIIIAFKGTIMSKDIIDAISSRIGGNSAKKIWTWSLQDNCPGGNRCTMYFYFKK